VNQILVAINKLDAAIPPWSVDRYNTVKDAVEPFLKQIGFKQNKVSTATSLNIHSLYTTHACKLLHACKPLAVLHTQR
jgi:translation elongation factor EF-1alpha